MEILQRSFQLIGSCCWSGGRDSWSYVDEEICLSTSMRHCYGGVATELCVIFFAALLSKVGVRIYVSWKDAHMMTGHTPNLRNCIAVRGKLLKGVVAFGACIQGQST